MKTFGIITGMISGAAVTATAITMAYPDVYRRIVRDCKRYSKKSKKLMGA